MISTFGGMPLKASQQSGYEGENVTFHRNLSQYLHTASHNTSGHHGCETVVFSEMQYIPWDNPDNIVSAEVENIVCKIKNNLLMLLFLIDGPANLINMAVFYKQGLRDRVNLCLFALSLADELQMVISIINHGEQIHIQFTTKEKFGPIYSMFSSHNLVFLMNVHYVSFVLSAIIATERCLCVFNPLKFQRLLSTKTMAVIIIVVYIVVLGLYFIAAFRYRVGCYYDPVTDVTVMTAVEGEFYKAHKELVDPLEIFTFGVGIPGTVMIVVITTTTLTIVKLRQIVRWRSKTSSSISASEVALTKALVANSIFFMVCLFPMALNRFTWLFFPEINIGGRYHNLFLVGLWIDEILTYINATFNIFVYYVMGTRYRETFWSLFGRKMQSKSTTGSTMSMATRSAATNKT